MLFTTAILAAVLVSLALTTLVGALMLRRAGRALASHASDQRLVASLVRIQTAGGGVQSGAERALWAVTGFDNRAEQLKIAMIGRRAQMDQARQLMVGIGGKVDRLRSITRLVIGL